MRLLIRLVGIFLTVVFVLVVAAGIFLYTLDPNTLKPEIEKQAAQRGAYLKLAGDMHLRIWPNIGFSLDDAALYDNPEHTGEALLKFSELNFSLALKPLLSRSIQVDGIDISGLRANYRINKEGSSNWDTLLNKQTEPGEMPEAESAPESTSAPKLEIKRIDISDAQFIYDDASSGSHMAINALNAQVEAVNIDAAPMTFSAAFSLTWADLQAVDVELKFNPSVDLEKQHATIANAVLKAAADGTTPLLLNASAEVDFGKGDLQATYELATEKARSWLAWYDANLLEGLGSDVLQSVNTRGDIQWINQQLSADNLTVRFDDTRFEGKLNYAHPENQALSIHSEWLGTNLNLDRYLPPSETSAEDTAPESTEEDTPLPLEALRNIQSTLRFSMDRLTAKTLNFDNIRMDAAANNGLIELKSMTADLAEGKLNTTANFDARSDTAKLEVNAKSDGINVGQIIMSLAQLDYVQGKLSSNALVQTQGSSTKALSDNLKISADANSPQLRLTPVNLVHKFCESFALISGRKLQKTDWVSYTDLAPVTLQATLANDTLAMESFQASIQKLNAAANGNFDLSSGKFNFPIELRLADFAKELDGCDFISDEWRKQVVPLRCKGNINNIGADTCLPDIALLRSKLKANVNRELDKEREKVKDKIDDRARDLLDKHLNEDEKQQVNDLLKRFKK